MRHFVAVCYCLCLQGGGGHYHMPCSHNCDCGQDIDCNFSPFDHWPHKTLVSWPLTVTFDPKCSQLQDGTCGSRRELVLCNAGIKVIIMMGLLLVLCRCDLFGSVVKSSLVPKAPVLFVSKPTGMATMQCWLRWSVTHEKLDGGLGMRLIFTVKSSSFKCWPAAKNPFWPLTALWPRSQLWLQGIWEWPPLGTCISLCQVQVSMIKLKWCCIQQPRN